MRDDAVLHDESRAPDRRNVAYGITVDGDQVGKQTIADSANPVSHMQDACVDGSGRAQGIKRRGCSRTCECASMSPGISVSPGRSMDSAPAGIRTAAAGPAESIFSPRTTTTQRMAFGKQRN